MDLNRKVSKYREREKQINYYCCYQKETLADIWTIKLAFSFDGSITAKGLGGGEGAFIVKKGATVPCLK